MINKWQKPNNNNFYKKKHFKNGFVIPCWIPFQWARDSQQRTKPTKLYSWKYWPVFLVRGLLFTFLTKPIFWIARCKLTFPSEISIFLGIIALWRLKKCLLLESAWPFEKGSVCIEKFVQIFMTSLHRCPKHGGIQVYYFFLVGGPKQYNGILRGNYS